MWELPEVPPETAIQRHLKSKLGAKSPGQKGSDSLGCEVGGLLCWDGECYLHFCIG